MNQLKFITKTTHHIDPDELAQFLKNEYSIENYDFQQVEESSNDTTHEFNVFQKYLYRDDLEEINLMKLNKQVKIRHSRLVLLMLMLDGHIPEGEYFIRVCW